MKKGQRIAEVCKQLDLQPYVLRYWLTEFPLLRGDDSVAPAQRLFQEPEIAILARIKTLLYDEGYTIAGAKKKLESEPAEAARSSAGSKRPGAKKRRAGKGPAPADGAGAVTDVESLAEPAGKGAGDACRHRSASEDRSGGDR